MKRVFLLFLIIAGSGKAFAQSFPNLMCCNSGTLTCVNTGPGTPSNASCPNPSGSDVELAVSVSSGGTATLTVWTSEPGTGFVGTCVTPTNSLTLPTVCYQVIPDNGLSVDPGDQAWAVTLATNLTVECPGCFPYTAYQQGLTDCVPHPTGQCPGNTTLVSHSCCGGVIGFSSDNSMYGSAVSVAAAPACQGVGTGIEASPDSSSGSCPAGQVNRLRDNYDNYCCATPLPPCSGVGTGVEATPDTSTGSCPAHQVNTGTLRDSLGNYCCSPTSVPATTPVMAGVLAIGLLLAAFVVRAKRA
jgi:hypothetical protein